MTPGPEVVSAVGASRRRALVVTDDPHLVEKLRQDSRLAIMAHLEDPGLAGAVAATLPVDLVLADEGVATAVQQALAAHGLVLEVCRVPVRLWVPPPPAGRAEAGAGTQPASVPACPATLREWSAYWGGPGAGVGAEDGRRHRPQGGGVTEVLMRQVIVITSPKGGVGKTFISVNLAAGLARHTGFRVLLLDLDLRSADVAVHLDLLGRSTLADLLPYAGALERAHLERAVANHPPSRLDVILAPARPEAAETVSREHLAALFRLGRQLYDFVVVDTSPDPADPVLAACLDEASAVVLVTTLDAAALRQCRNYLETLAGGGYGPDTGNRLTLVLNQAHQAGPVTADRAARFLGLAVPTAPRLVRVPEDRARVEQAIYEGRPLILADPGHPVARAVFELGHIFCPVFSGLLGGPSPQRGAWRGLVEALRRW